MFIFLKYKSYLHKLLQILVSIILKTRLCEKGGVLKDLVIFCFDSHNIHSLLTILPSFLIAIFRILFLQISLCIIRDHVVYRLATFHHIIDLHAI